MATIRKTISFTDQHDAWIKARIASDSEYVRDLIRRDQQEHERYMALKTALTEGLESGISERNVQDIMREVERKLRDHGKLPSDTQSR